MAFPRSILLFQLLAIGYFTGAAAETCYGAYTSIYCIFGCCSNTFLTYCCISNGLGIGIIVGSITIILSVIGFCFRRRYGNRPAVQYASHNQGAPNVSVVSSNNSDTSQMYGPQYSAQYGGQYDQYSGKFPNPVNPPPYPGQA